MDRDELRVADKVWPTIQRYGFPKDEDNIPHQPLTPKPSQSQSQSQSQSHQVRKVQIISNVEYDRILRSLSDKTSSPSNDQEDLAMHNNLLKLDRQKAQERSNARVKNWPDAKANRKSLMIKARKLKREQAERDQEMMDQAWALVMQQEQEAAQERAKRLQFEHSAEGYQHLSKINLEHTLKERACQLEYKKQLKQRSLDNDNKLNKMHLDTLDKQALMQSQKQVERQATELEARANLLDQAREQHAQKVRQKSLKLATETELIKRDLEAVQRAQADKKERLDLNRQIIQRGAGQVKAWKQEERTRLQWEENILQAQIERHLAAKCYLSEKMKQRLTNESIQRDNMAEERARHLAALQAETATVKDNLCSRWEKLDFLKAFPSFHEDETGNDHNNENPNFK